MKLDNSQKLQVLLHMSSKFNDQIFALENLANKITLSVSTGLLIIPIFVIWRLSPVDWFIRWAVILLLIALTITAIWLLKKNRDHIQWLCRATVRVQQVLGFYEEKKYFSLKEVNKSHLLWVKEPVLLPLESQRWGSDDWLLTQVPYILAIVCSCLAGASIIAWG